MIDNGRKNVQTHICAVGIFSLSKHCPTSQCEQSHSTIYQIIYITCCNFTKSFIKIYSIELPERLTESCGDFNWINEGVVYSIIISFFKFGQIFYFSEKNFKNRKKFPPYCGTGLDSLEPISISGQWSESYWINPKCKGIKAIETGVILLIGLNRTGLWVSWSDRTGHPNLPNPNFHF